MIPILYNGNEQNFLNNGLGRLADAISCKVTEERNGIFELEMTYPVTGIHFDELAINRIILAKTEDGGNNQPFIIYKISRPLNGKVTINAEHISYLLNGFVVMPFSAVSCADAFSKIASNIVLNTPFTFSTDVQSTVAFKLESPRSVRGLLGGEQGSLLDTYSGGYDYKFDRFNVYLYANRGNDNGVTLRYGKNITELKNTNDSTNIFTGIVPFWAGGEDSTPVYLTEKVVYSSHADDYPYKIIKTVDFSSEFETAPTEAQLRAKAQSYVENNANWKIKNNIDVSFVNLAQTEDYKEFAALERVRLCDIVTVVYTKLGVDVKTKVIKTVYNVLTEKYDSITLGDTTYTLAQAIQGALDTPTATEMSSSIKSAVARATKLIQGGLGGHVVFNTDANGEPMEILIMDEDNIADAVNVIRMNLNGIGFSHNGYEGPFETAWTIDGHFVADYIDTGNLNGGLISANTINANALTVEARKELASIHNYLPSDAFTNISRWERQSYYQSNVYFQTIGIKTYLVLDGSQLNEFSTGAYARIATDVVGRINFDAHLKYHVDTEVTVPSQRFMFVVYAVSDGTHYVNYKTLPAQTIPANTDFIWDMTFEINNVDTNDYAPRFGLYFIPGTKIYVEELTVKSTLDSYAEAGLDFTSAGLSVVAQEVEQAGAHSYLPYDMLTNPDRWKIKQPDTPGHIQDIRITHETLTISGESVDAICIDGTHAESAWIGGCECYVETDVIGAPKLELKYTYQYDSDIEISSGSVVSVSWLKGLDDSGNLNYNFSVDVSGPSTIRANEEMFVDREATPSPAYDYFRQKPRLIFYPRTTAKLYIYNVSLESTGKAYKKASLSYTADGLDSTVKAGDIISNINQSAEAVSISASKINLTGDLSLRGDFHSYNPNDNTTFVFIDSGNLKFYESNDVIFAIAADYDGHSGIIFGDPDEYMTNRFTIINQSLVKTENLLGYYDGSNSSFSGDDTLISEGTARFFGAIEVNDTVLYDATGTHVNNVFFNDTQFNGTVYNANATIVFISDKRKKRSIKDLVLDKAKSFIMALKPVKFKFKEEISKSDRFHHGFIAQDVKNAMGEEDWGLYCEDKEHDFIGLRYDEIIADLVKVVQDQEKRIEALERARNDDTTI